MLKKVVIALGLAAGLVGCGAQDKQDEKGSELKTAYYPDGRAAIDDAAHSVRVTVPAGQIFRFKYSFHGDAAMGITIYNETLDEKVVVDTNWFNNHARDRPYDSQRSTNKDMVYVITGFSKGCWYNQKKCGHLPWLQEKIELTGEKSASFTGQLWQNQKIINVSWSAL